MDVYNYICFSTYTMIFEVNNKHIQCISHTFSCYQKAWGPNIRIWVFFYYLCPIPWISLPHLKNKNYFCLAPPISQVCENDRQLLSQRPEHILCFWGTWASYLINSNSKEWSWSLSYFPICFLFVVFVTCVPRQCLIYLLTFLYIFSFPRM